jgi:hypothetical protein
MSLCINALQREASALKSSLALHKFSPFRDGGACAMAKYLVTCSCGRQLAVETGQAGETITCDGCGATIVAPTLRQLRTLPVATEAAGTTTTGPSWGARQGAMTASLLVAVLCLILAAVSRMSEIPVPEFDPAARTATIDRDVANMTPVNAWDIWVNNYRTLSLTGFEVFKHPATASMQTTLDWHRAIQKTLVSVAAACTVGAVVLWLSTRGGDKETRRQGA